MSKGNLDEREILICCTFRPFNGGANAKIHEAFLDSLLKQTYKKFRLIVSNYREEFKEQKCFLNSKNIPFELIQSKIDHRWSFTDMVQNAWPYLEKNKHILIWMNSDIVFDPNFLEEVICNFKAGSAGTSYPMFYYNSLKSFENREPTAVPFDFPMKSFWDINPNLNVCELMYIDGDFFLEPQHRDIFSKFFFLDSIPGFSLSLCFAYFSKDLRNLFFRTKLHCISNDRTDEPLVKNLLGTKSADDALAKKIMGQYFNREVFRASNKLVYESCSARNIPKKLYQYSSLRKLRIISGYKPVGTSAQILSYKLYLGCWAFRGVIQKRIQRFKEGKFEDPQSSTLRRLYKAVTFK